jgi:hypothetical protein
VSSREAAIDFVDMRYSNGFTIGWKDGVKAPLADPRVPGKEMVAGRILQ